MTGAGWLGGALRWQSRAAVLLAVVLCGAAIAGAPLGLGMQYAVLLGGMALVGIPHGGFDHLVARPVLAPRLGRWWWVPFGAGYVGLAALVGVAWAVAPAWTLAGFLAASVVHFGLGDREPGVGPRWAGVLALGAMPVLLPAVLHPAEAAPILAAMARIPLPAMTDALAAAWWLVLPWGALFTWMLVAAVRQRARWGEPLAMLAAFVLLPPLLAFGIYFTAAHAMRHTLRLGAWHDARRAGAAARWLVRGMVPTAVVAVAAMAVLGRSALDWPLDVLAPVFQAIAALTLPHMIVTGLLEEPAGSA